MTKLNEESDSDNSRHGGGGTNVWKVNILSSCFMFNFKG